MNITYRKKSISIIFTLQVLASTVLQANEFEIGDVDLESHGRTYNRLSGAKKSDALLKASSSRFQSFMEEAQEVVAEYDLQDSFGLRLIHRHFPIENDSLMVEDYEVVNGTPSLVTQAQGLESAKRVGAIPASWIFTDEPNDGGLLFEASTDPAVHTAHSKLKDPDGFFTKIGGLLRRHKLNDLLSLSVLVRNRLVAGENQMYMENTYKSSGRSVVQLWDIKEKPLESFVRTSWSFEGSKLQGCVCSSWWICTPVGCYMAGSHNDSDDN
jgi:hypothetical protein